MQPNQERKALFIGIKDYDDPKAKLRACINDAEAMYRLLRSHENGDPNFTTGNTKVHKDLTNEGIKAAIKSLLQENRARDHALFYFAGHGYVDDSGEGYLVGKDYSRERNDMGVPMSWLVEQLNQSSISEITVILDCCFSGNFADQLGWLKQNITLLASTTKNDIAAEGFHNGHFTSILMQGLNGAAADAFGHVTAAGLYNLADSKFSPWEQRPVFKASLTKMTPLRISQPVMSKEDFRKLTSRDFFPNDTGKTRLSPSDICTDPKLEKKTAHFEDLIQFQRAGLIECPGNKTIYQAALDGEYYQLSAFGEVFRDLVQKERF